MSSPPRNDQTDGQPRRPVTLMKLAEMRALGEPIVMLTAAVRRGLRTPLLVGDLPFGSYEASDEQAIATAHRFVKEAGCDAVKIEGSAARAKAIVRAGVPVMGHVGLTPQTATALGGYRAQGRTAERARAVLEEA